MSTYPRAHLAIYLIDIVTLPKGLEYVETFIHIPSALLSLVLSDMKIYFYFTMNNTDKVATFTLIVG
jgi:hypothetical protein